MFASRYAWVLLAVAAMAASGCNDGDNAADSESDNGGKPAADGAKYLLAEEPADAKDVRQVRETAADGDDVVVVGRIGGEENPWVEGFAAFGIVDTSLKACSDVEGDDCPIPWDYCCEPELPKSRLFVKVVDDDGKPVATGAKDLLGLKELQTVVVQGAARRDADGNVTLLAKGIYVRP